MSQVHRYHVAIPVMITEMKGSDVVQAAEEDKPPRAALMIKLVIAAQSPEHAARLFQERIDGAFGDP